MKSQTSRKAARPPEGVDKAKVAEFRKAMQAMNRGPSCKDCGGTNIKDTYTSKIDGSEIDEADILEDAIHAMVDLLQATYGELLDDEAAARILQNRARTLAGLVDMWIARPYEEEAAEASTPATSC